MPRANWTTSITKAAKLARRRTLILLAVSRPALLGTAVPVGTLMTLPKALEPCRNGCQHRNRTAQLSWRNVPQRAEARLSSRYSTHPAPVLLDGFRHVRE